MKRFLYLIIFLIQSIIVNGQKGYYVKDSIATVGIRVIDRGAIQNARQCQIGEKNKKLIYSPDEVEEYGFDDVVYVSRIIKINNEEKKVFLERLNKGKINLYYYRDRHGRTYFLEKGSGKLVELSKNDNEKNSFKDLLKYYVLDCDSINDALKLLRYNKAALSIFVNQYNLCIRKPFPFIRYGLTIGYGVAQPEYLKISDEVLRNTVFKKDKSFNIGLFTDIPILHSYFSLHSELYFQKNAFSGHSVIDKTVNDILINTSSINIPLLIRYTYPSLKLRPYVNIGGSFTYNIRNNNAVCKATIFNNIIAEEFNNSTIYSEKQIGYTVGSGIQYNIDYRKSIFFELRFNNLYGLTKETYGNKNFQGIIGINF
jgi:hypothetical protein